MMTSVRGSSGIVISMCLVFMTLFILGGIKLSEKKIELDKNIKEWELVSASLEEENKNILKEIEL